MACQSCQERRKKAASQINKNKSNTPQPLRNLSRSRIRKVSQVRRPR